MVLVGLCGVTGADGSLQDLLRDLSTSCVLGTEALNWATIRKRGVSADDVDGGETFKFSHWPFWQMPKEASSGRAARIAKMKCELSDVGIDRGVKGDGLSGDGLINRQTLEVSRLGVRPGTASTGAAQGDKGGSTKGGG